MMAIVTRLCDINCSRIRAWDVTRKRDQVSALLIARSDSPNNELRHLLPFKAWYVSGINASLQASRVHRVLPLILTGRSSIIDDFKYSAKMLASRQDHWHSNGEASGAITSVRNCNAS
jgi:hypothetical protein